MIKPRASGPSLSVPLILARRSGGEFHVVVYNTHVDSSEHLALIKGEISPDEEILVRVHSKYVPGDVFGFEFLNTGAVIQQSMEMIAQEGKGIILYLQPEGQGLQPAMKTYPTVEGKRKTDINPTFVYHADFREYGIGAQILRDLGVRKMRLLTNNRRNLVGLSGYGLEVTATIPLGQEVPTRREPERSQSRS